MAKAALTQQNETQKVAPPAGTEVPCVPGYRAASIARANQIDFEPTNALMLEYIATQVEIYERTTGGAADGSAHIQHFWDSLDSVLPPDGRFYLVWSEAGSLLGCGALKRLDGATGEMKHLYVRPSARGTGLGRWLAEQRLADARAMGLRTILVDTVKGNVDMPRLYAKLGFEETAPHGSGTSATVMPHVAVGLRFFRKNL